MIGATMTNKELRERAEAATADLIGGGTLNADQSGRFLNLHLKAYGVTIEGASKLFNGEEGVRVRCLYCGSSWPYEANEFECCCTRVGNWNPNHPTPHWNFHDSIIEGDHLGDILFEGFG
jgi:hypothetical protein